MGMGGTAEEEMEAFKKVIEVILEKVRHITKEPIRSEKDISEEDRFLVERRVHHHDKKGKTMWDCIGAEYDEKYGTTQDPNTKSA